MTELRSQRSMEKSFYANPLFAIRLFASSPR
jgi:hypothetical protein